MIMIHHFISATFVGDAVIYLHMPKNSLLAIILQMFDYYDACRA